MTREEAYQLLTEMIQNKNLQKHGLAVEAIMRSLCKHLRQMHHDRGANDENFDEEEWGIVGLLHDADYEIVGKDLERHTLVTEEKLRFLNASERIINGIKAHNNSIKKQRENLMERSVFAADELSGLIIASALVRPDKSLSSLTVDSILKRFKEKSFAAGANREHILACEKELNMSLEEFVGVALKAMQEISKELGL